jgi:hypothetical protein
MKKKAIARPNHGNEFLRISSDHGDDGGAGEGAGDG